MTNTREIRDFYNKISMNSQSTEMWGDFLVEIRESILIKNIETFKEWPPIRATMNAGDPTTGFTRKHLDILRAREDWASRWEPATKVEFTTNAVNHSFYLTKLEDTVKSIDKVDFIFEFGAGFGNMCRLVKSLGFKGKYIIFDFPELLAIQKYYLSTYNIEASDDLQSDVTLCCDMAKLQSMIQGKENALCISNHALEEAPDSVMFEVLSYVKDFEMFLFAFSGGKDKFEDFVAQNNIKHLNEEFPSMKGHYIIAGAKND